MTILVHVSLFTTLVRPIGFFEEFDDTGSGTDEPVTFYDMLAPCGFVNSELSINYVVFQLKL